MLSRTKRQPLTRPPSRRTLLTAGLAGTSLLAGGWGLTACSSTDRQEAAVAADSDRLRKRAAKDTAALLAAYDATVSTHPRLAGELRPIRADLARHLTAFGGSRTPAGSARVPARPDAARAALADATRRSADRAATDLLTAPPDLARLLASVAAARAGHVLLLGS
ncbi:hypothetical protein AQ490_02170 [Wenjunlia vitaminophila]|uniref:Lipoprotein n=1 Tax=Wenjunlia vitaminophila TaxID=76728 RepID=A0A0T6LYA2_WENVI|nr:hypothetical protein [Wenjunlia vitaminophila]KRV51034.1 hypothetical protein AQ490_02170 [Wenjunlia vitaminophila]